MLRSWWMTLAPLALGLGPFHSPSPDCPPYLVGVGDLPGDTFLSFTNSLTPDGQVVVGGSNADDPSVPDDGNSAAWQHANQGFRWFPPCPGTPQVLEGFGYPFTGVHPESNAKGISPDGAFVAGDATYGPSIPTTFKPVLWSSPGTYLELERLAGHVSGSASDVSNDSPIHGHLIHGTRPDRRLVVGYSTTASNHAQRVPGAVPVYWAFPNTAAVPLPFPAGVDATFGEARGVSRDGRVIVGNLYHFVGATLSNTTACAWVWRPGRPQGGFEALVLSQPAGRVSGWVAGISDDGRVVTGNGHDSLDDFGLETPCVWRGSGPPPFFGFGPPEILSMLPGSSGASALGVSADGQVVGGQCVIDFVTHAVRWSGPGLTTLEDVLVSAAAHGVATDTWTLWYVTGLSADGEMMIGTGDHLDENDEFVIEGWAARIPLP